MVRIKKEFLNNYDILQLNTNARTFNEIAKKNSDDYIFTSLPSSDNEDLITSILCKSKEVNHSLLNSWEDKPWSDDEIYNTANSYLTNQFESSKLSIKNEIPITGEDSAKMRFSLLLNTYLPVLVAHLTLHDNYTEGYKTFLKALSWDEETIFFPLPLDENGLIIWDDIFDKNEEEEKIEQDPITYDAAAIEELLENMYEKLCEKINHKVDEMKEYMKHIYKMIPLSSTEFDKDMNELIIDEGAEAINEKIDNLNTEADTIIKEQESDDIDMLTDANNRFKDKVKTLKNQIDIIDKENDRLVKRESEIESEIIDLKNKISDLEEQLENNKESEDRNLDEGSSAIIGVKDNEIAELKQELETRKENERLLRDRNAELEEGDNTLRKELNKVNEDNVNLNRELSTLQNEISNYIDTNRELERANEKLTASNKDLEKNINDLEKELASIKKERGIDELEKIKEDNRILRQALEDLKHKKDNEKYIAKELPKEVEDNPVSDKDPEVLAREKANRDRIGRMIYGDAYDGTQTF